MSKNPGMLTLVIFLFFMFGCSSADNPVTPLKSDESTIAIGITVDPVVFPWGVFAGYLNTDTLDAELLPSRNATKIGDVFDTDITQFLMYSPCWNCLRIASVDVDPSGNVLLGIAAKHPISSIAARPDLHAFDARGILLLESDTNFDMVYQLPGESGTDTLSGNSHLVLNADGWTTHFDEISNDLNYFDPPIDVPGNLNPFKRFFTDHTTPAFDPLNPAGYNVFPVESDWETQQYVLDVSKLSGTLDFILVMDASYGHSAVYTTRDNPEYYLPNYNRKEAWRVDVNVIDNQLVAKKTDTTARIEIEIYDWQAGRTADPNYPDNTHLGGIPYTSDVASVRASVPGLIDGVVLPVDPRTGGGVWGDPYRYEIEFTNTLAANAGEHIGLVCVRDELWNDSGPYPVVSPPVGFPFDGPDLRDYAAYKVFKLPIPDPWDMRPVPFPGDAYTFFGHSLGKGDFNNDGIPDLAVGATGADTINSGAVLVFFGNGNGFDETSYLTLDTDDQGYSYRDIGYSLCVAKINDDEFDDIATCSDDGAVALFISDGLGGFNEPVVAEVSVDMTESFGFCMDVGRFNNDPYLEIAVDHNGAEIGGDLQAGQIWVFTYDGATTLTPVSLTLDPVLAHRNYGRYFSFAKINSDDYDDLIVAWDIEISPTEYGDIEYALATGMDGIYNRKSLRAEFPSLRAAILGSAVEAVDLNGDGIQEWIITAEMNDVDGVHSAGEFFIFYPDGNGGFRGYKKYSNGAPEVSDRLGERYVRTGDFNADGALDIVLSSMMGNSSAGLAQVFLATPGGYEFYKRYEEPPLELGHYYRFGVDTLAINVDSDPGDELIIGSLSEGWEGRVYVYFDP